MPLDDEHTMVWEPNWHPTEALSDDVRRGWKGRVPPSGMRPADGTALSRGRFVAGADNDYLIDRERQRTSNFTGLEESASCCCRATRTGSRPRRPSSAAEPCP